MPNSLRYVERQHVILGGDVRGGGPFLAFLVRKKQDAQPYGACKMALIKARVLVVAVYITNLLILISFPQGHGHAGGLVGTREALRIPPALWASVA